MNVLEIKAENLVANLVRNYPLTIIDFGVDMQNDKTTLHGGSSSSSIDWITSYESESESDNDSNGNGNGIDSDSGVVNGNVSGADFDNNNSNYLDNLKDIAVESFFNTNDTKKALTALNEALTKLPFNDYIQMKYRGFPLEYKRTIRGINQYITGFPDKDKVDIEDETQIEEMSVGSVKCGANACVRLTEGTEGNVLERKEIKLDMNDRTREEFRQENERRLKALGESGLETTKHEPMSCNSIGYVTKSGKYKCFYVPPEGTSEMTTRQDGKKGLKFAEGESTQNCETGKQFCNFPSEGFKILREKLGGITLDELDETTLPHLFQTETKLIRGLTVGEFYWMLNNVILKEQTPEQIELYYHIIRQLETLIKAMYDKINKVFVENGLLPITIQEQHMNNVVLQNLTKKELKKLTTEELKKKFDSQGALLPSSVNNNESLIALEELPNNNNYDNATGGSRKIVIKSKKNNGNKNTKLKTKNLSKKYKRNKYTKSKAKEVKKLGLLSGGSKKNTSKNRFDYYINKVILVNIPNVKRPRYRWIVRKRSDGRIVVRVPKNNVLVRNLNDKNISDFGEESLLQKGASIYSKKI